MEFGSHLDASVTLAVDLVNALTPSAEHGRPVDLRAQDVRRDRLVTALGDRTTRARTAREVDEAHLNRVREAAGLLRRVFEAAARGDLDAAAAATNEALARYEARPELSRHDGRPWHVHFHAASADLAAVLGAGSATALALVISDTGTDRLGVCDADHCDRVYVDTSRNASKRFCSTTCQNRTKAAAFRARRANEPR